MLKALSRLCLEARAQKATWERWYRKEPHNRVRRPRIRDDQGRVVGRGPAEPLPEPTLSPLFCQKRQLPSGRWEVVFTGASIETAYRQARFPAATPDAVPHLAVDEEVIRKLSEQVVPT